MKRYTSEDIYRVFLKNDKDTVLRKLNLRYFSRDYNVDYYITQSIWFIDFEDFMKKINPNGIDRECKMPRLRTKITAQNEWNSHHREKIKHFIIDQICVSGKVIVRKHGRYNLINYDELEQELIKILKEKNEY